MIDPLHTIATRLAHALENTPCTCISVGQWPLFVAESKAHKARTCGRCAALDAWRAYTEIVQTPETKHD